MYGGRSDGSNFMDILRTGTRTWRLVARFAKLGNDIKNELYTPTMPTKHTHLLRNIFANSDVECILRAKTLQLNLTGAIE
jgi:hypothetical protein